MLRETFREICRNRRLSWGTVVIEYMTPQTVRTLAQAGYDWLWLEREHGHHSYGTIQEVVRTANDLGVLTLLRVTQTDYALIARALDLGLSGIIVPRVETPEQVRMILDYAKYPPVGKRGFGMRPSIWGRDAMTMQERIEDQNTCRFVVIQIESRLGVKNIEAMLDTAAGHVDAVFVGPADFQVDIGKPDTYPNPELDEAARRIANACATRGVSSGAPVGSVADAAWWIERGFNLITLGYDEGFMRRAAREDREALRAFE